MHEIYNKIYCYRNTFSSIYTINTAQPSSSFRTEDPLLRHGFFWISGKFYGVVVWNLLRKLKIFNCRENIYTYADLINLVTKLTTWFRSKSSSLLPFPWRYPSANFLLSRIFRYLRFILNILLWNILDYYLNYINTRIVESPLFRTSFSIYTIFSINSLPLIIYQSGLDLVISLSSFCK